MSKTTVFLSVSVIFFFCLAATSCATYLSAGQLGEDSLAPPPLRPSAADENKTEILAAVSQANGDWYNDDYNRMFQAGVVRAWRRTGGGAATEGHFAASGWYGQAKLTEHYDGQYIPSVATPFVFYGGTAQAEEGLSLGNDRTFSIGIAFRGSVAYEDGTYRKFRAKAAQLSTTGNADYSVVDQSPSNWSGMLGPDFSTTFAIDRNFMLRIGLVEGWLRPDLGTFFSGSSSGLQDILAQDSLEIESGAFCFAAYLNYTTLNYGVGLSLGYVLP